MAVSEVLWRFRLRFLPPLRVRGDLPCPGPDRRDASCDELECDRDDADGRQSSLSASKLPVPTMIFGLPVRGRRI